MVQAIPPAIRILSQAGRQGYLSQTRVFTISAAIASRTPQINSFLVYFVPATLRNSGNEFIERSQYAQLFALA